MSGNGTESNATLTDLRNSAVSGETAFNLAAILGSLGQDEKALSVFTAVELELTFLHQVPEHDYTKNPFYGTSAPPLPLRDVFRANEHVSVLLSLVCNSLIILVFVRVLGLTRLPARIIVNLAVINIISTISVLLHTSTVTVEALHSGERICRFVSQFSHQCFVLVYNGLSAAIMERLLAFNVPKYHHRAMGIIGPVILMAPWGYKVLSLFLFNIGFYEFDTGYECASHLIIAMPDVSMHAAPESAIFVCLILTGVLIVTLLFKNRSAGDVWEQNRIRLELKTSKVILKVCAMTMLFSLPILFAMPLLLREKTQYDHYRYIHLMSQLSFHKGLALFIVLITRKEFRQHIMFVFDSRENIHRSRMTNLMYVKSRRSLSAGDVSRQLRFSNELASSSATTAPIPRPPTSLSDAVSLRITDRDRDSNEQRMVALQSRDQGHAIQTPDWLKRKESSPPSGAWNFAEYLGYSGKKSKTNENV